MEGTGTIGSFPLPSQIKDVPGAEGWRSMYPYFTRFQPEDDNRFWFYNAMHFPEPMPAFDVVTAEIPYTAIGANTARVFVFPTTLGIEHRIVNGRIYITAIPVTLTGKKLEVPVRKILRGVPADEAANRHAMANPGSLDFFADYAATQQDYPIG